MNISTPESAVCVQRTTPLSSNEVTPVKASWLSDLNVHTKTTSVKLDMYGRGGRRRVELYALVLRSSRGSRRQSPSPHKQRSSSRGSFRRSRSPSLRSVTHRRRSSSRSSYHRSRSPRHLNAIRRSFRSNTPRRETPTIVSRVENLLSVPLDHVNPTPPDPITLIPSQSDSDRCYTCGELGHRVRLCPKRHRKSCTRGSPRKRPPSNRFLKLLFSSKTNKQAKEME